MEIQQEVSKTIDVQQQVETNEVGDDQIDFIFLSDKGAVIKKQSLLKIFKEYQRQTKNV